ncbi:MAG: hypothetical protein WD048_11115 [Chitinophagales bacterium]
MKNIIASFIVIIIILPCVFSQENKPNNTISEVAPNMPERPEGELIELHDYRMAMDEWVAEYPEEFKKAVAIDASLNVFAPIKSRAPKPGDRPLSLPPVGTLPAFMNYPVNETKPYFIDNNNPDYDSLVYKRKLQHWYYEFNKETYVQKYGELPTIPDSIEIISHPNQFPTEVDTSQYKGYYPEFN